MTDDIAATLLSQYLALEANYAALLKAYAPRFQRVLSARKVVRLYQIENKLRALVNYELGREIPLMEERFRILSDLHGQIQDAFNEVGVQIMSPRFEAQPTQPVIVPASRWYEPPAARPGRCRTRQRPRRPLTHLATGGIR